MQAEVDAKQASQAEEESMHPSWKAKKAQSSGIVGFQGKKVVFGGDDGDDVKPRVVKEGQASASGANRSLISAPTPAAKTDLHPSWQAKKAQTSGIVAFKGKKLVFGEDDEDASGCDGFQNSKKLGSRKRPFTQVDQKPKEDKAQMKKHRRRGAAVDFKGSKKVFF